jgi:hypothetical protein
MADNSITNITNFFDKGFQRTNRFEVTIIKDNTVAGPFWASQSQIPAQTIVYFPETFAPSGPQIMIPVKREYDDRFLIDFIVDQDWKVRIFFENWYNSMFTALNTNLLGAKSNSLVARNTVSNLAKIEIKALATNGEEKQLITLYEAYPKLLLPGQFSHDIPNQYLTLSVDFNYRYYKITALGGIFDDTDNKN